MRMRRIILSTVALFQVPLLGVPGGGRLFTVDPAGYVKEGSVDGYLSP